MITSSRGAIYTSLIREQNLARFWWRQKKGAGPDGPSVDGMRRSENRLAVTSPGFLKVNSSIGGVRGGERRLGDGWQGGEAPSRFALVSSYHSLVRLDCSESFVPFPQFSSCCVCGVSERLKKQYKSGILAPRTGVTARWMEQGINSGPWWSWCSCCCWWW